ncbi:MAG: hypothetical protein AAGH78_00595 [Cyanobacteria bacterium P01_H01_bin.58]
MAEHAIANSSEIAAIEQRLELSAERRHYTESRSWTNWITADPFELVQNILGGGDVGRDRLQLAALEVEEANLIRRREEVAESLAREVIGLVLEYEELSRKLEALEGQLETQLQRQAVMEMSYRTGQGSTDRMLTMWQRTDTLRSRIEEVEIEQGQGVRELEVLCRVEESEVISEPETIDSL